MRYLLLTLLMLASCGNLPMQQPYYGQFADLVNKFQQEAKAHGRIVDASHLVVQVKTLTANAAEPGQIIGLCGLYDIGPTVYLDPSLVAPGADPTLLEHVFYHELGHCLLNREHRGDTMPNGQPLSIMYPAAFADIWYLNNRAAYMDELFLHD